MTSNAFGGPWTEDKLNALGKYLRFYVTALRDQRFRLVYVDTFAGTGRCKIRTGSESHKVIDGSATIALDCGEGFDEYHFIEFKPRHCRELQQLKAEHPAGQRATLYRGAADGLLMPILARFDWRNTRGVLFLDPYGLQCSWSMVQQVAATKALDVFFLVSLSGLYRNAAVDRRGVDASKAAALNRFLGTDAWQSAVYTRQQEDLFDAPQVTRAPGAEGMLQFTTKRLREAFPYVAEPCLLGQANGAPLYALYFAVANPSKPALALASKVADDVLRSLR